eukprot:507730-Rhodomonas_salina.1
MRLVIEQTQGRGGRRGRARVGGRQGANTTRLAEPTSSSSLTIQQSLSPRPHRPRRQFRRSGHLRRELRLVAATLLTASTTQPSPRHSMESVELSAADDGAKLRGPIILEALGDNTIRWRCSCKPLRPTHPPAFPNLQLCLPSYCPAHPQAFSGSLLPYFGGTRMSHLGETQGPDFGGAFRHRDL